MRRRLVGEVVLKFSNSLLGKDIVRTLVMVSATAQGQIWWYATPSGT